MSSIAVEDKWLAAIHYNRAKDQKHFRLGGTTINSQACAAYGGTPNTVINGRKGCDRLVNGINAYSRAINSSAASLDCQSLQAAFAAIDSGPINSNVTYNFGTLVRGDLNGFSQGKVFITQVNYTLFFGLP